MWKPYIAIVVLYIGRDRAHCFHRSEVVGLWSLLHLLLGLPSTTWLRRGSTTCPTHPLRANQAPGAAYSRTRRIPKDAMLLYACHTDRSHRRHPQGSLGCQQPGTDLHRYLRPLLWSQPSRPWIQLGDPVATATRLPD